MTAKNNHENHNEIFAYILIACMVLALAFIAIFIGGCSPITRLSNIEHKHPLTTAEWAAKAYPPQVSVIEKTFFKEGETIYDTAYQTIDCDSAIKYQTRFVNVPKIIQKVRIDTLVQTKEKTLKSTAEMAQIAILTNDANKLKSSRNFWMKIAIGLGVFLVGRFALALYLKK